MLLYQNWVVSQELIVLCEKTKIFNISWFPYIHPSAIYHFFTYLVYINGLQISSIYYLFYQFYF